MRMVYSETLMDHFERPRQAGRFDDAADDVGTGVVGTLETGGVLRLQLRVDADGLIVDTCFQAYGPPALVASGSWLAETIRGAALARVEALTHHSIIQALDLPPARVYCALQAQDAIQAAIQDYTDKQRAYA